MSALKLIEAAKAGNIEYLETLIAIGEDLEQADDYGWTALNWAAGKGYAGIIQKLLDSGANVTHTGRDKRTAYKIALAATHIESAALLQKAEQKAGLKPESEARPYCKAYVVEALRKFFGWREKLSNIDNDAIVFIHQDLSVTLAISHGENIVFDQSSYEWERFCREELAFSVPTELELAAVYVANKPVDSHQAQS